MLHIKGSYLEVPQRQITIDILFHIFQSECLFWAMYTTIVSNFLVPIVARTVTFAQSSSDLIDSQVSDNINIQMRTLPIVGSTN